MFSDEIQEVITLPSSWKVDRSLCDASCQTREIKFVDAATQNIFKQEIEIQTEEEDYPRSEDFVITKDNSQALVNFLLRVYPDISEQLTANERSNAFDGYDVNWEEEAETITCQLKLSHSEIEHKLAVTSVSWNCRGSVIAAAYGRNDHEGWCTHQSFLCTWNIDMRSINTKKADKALELDSCLMCVAFHPEHPPLIAGGTFNGEVVIWDLSQDEDSFIANSSRLSETHQEPVTKVFWVQNTNVRTRKYKLVSSGCDGKTYIWEFNGISKELKLERGFILLTADIPRNLRPTKLRNDTELGVTSLAFSKHDPNIFILGTESGGIFKCSMSATARPSKEVGSDVDICSPVTLAFQPHIGPVYSVDCSPFHRNVFLSCSTDTTANVYSLLQVKPLFTIESGSGYLFDAKWSTTRPLVLFLSTEDGKLLIYDLKTSQFRPSDIIEVNSNQSPVYTIQLNPKRAQLIATGDANGDICVWSLHDKLTNFHQKESEILDNMATVLDAD